MAVFHLAQFNQARAVAPLDSDVMASFMAELERINGLADAAPGFVWRLIGDELDAPAAVDRRDPRMLLNLSLWRSAEDLFAYVYRSPHGKEMRRRRQWFEPSELPQLALWWVPAGELPTLDEGIARLAHLREHGPTAYAFDLKRRFAAPAADAAERA